MCKTERDLVVGSSRPYVPRFSLAGYGPCKVKESVPDQRTPSLRVTQSEVVPNKGVRSFLKKCVIDQKLEPSMLYKGMSVNIYNRVCLVTGYADSATREYYSADVSLRTPITTKHAYLAWLISFYSHSR